MIQLMVLILVFRKPIFPADSEWWLKIIAGAGSGSGGTPSPEPTTLVLDTFTDNSVALDLHTPDIDVVGGGWTEYIGDLRCINDKLTTNGLVLHLGGIETNESDVTVQLTALDHITSGVQIEFRLVDSDNFWQANLENGKFGHRIAGVFTEMGDIGTPKVVPNTGRVICNGDSITFEAETGLSVTINDSTFQTATIHGVRMPADALFADDFSVTTI